MKTRKKLQRLAAIGIFTAVILVAATPAYAWSSVGFSGTFVGPHGVVSISTYPYHRYYRHYPYRAYAYPRVYYRHYCRPYVSSYYRPYYPVRRVYLRPAYYGPYCYPY